MNNGVKSKFNEVHGLVSRRGDCLKVEGNYEQGLSCNT